jgi:hypothetical protein
VDAICKLLLAGEGGGVIYYDDFQIEHRSEMTQNSGGIPKKSIGPREETSDGLPTPIGKQNRYHEDMIELEN